MVEEHDQLLVCSACGARNVAKVTDFRAGAANRDEESGDCASCGKRIIKKRCFAIEVRLADAARSGSLHAGSR
jgi:DNA-directed RNA polymerase subunit RPC12/RpoP